MSSEPTLEDFYAHVMYLTDCRNRGQQVVAWQCMDDAVRERWRVHVRSALCNWRAAESFLARERANGNPHAMFYP